MPEISNQIFNTSKTDYENPSLFLSEGGNGLFDTVNKQYPEIWKIYKTVKSLDWDEDEFDYSSCVKDFKTCDKSTYDMMIKTLAWQWEADSIASRISPIAGNIVTSPELWAAWQRISDQEALHAATYSEIVRNSFDDPSDIINEILSVSQSIERVTEVGKALSEVAKASHEYALGLRPNDQEMYNHCFMFPVAMFGLERIQFMASFAVTFGICDTGSFQPIGKAVQKIAQDEFETHVALDKAVIKHELTTARGKIAYETLKPRIQKLIDDIVEQEMEWIDYLFSEGRELLGLNADLLKKWTLFCARDVYEFLDLKSPRPLPRQNPLRFMEKWLNIGKTQPAPQEEQIGQYKVGIMVRDDETQKFDYDF